jgi:hypothetical protein
MAIFCLEIYNQLKPFPSPHKQSKAPPKIQSNFHLKGKTANSKNNLKFPIYLNKYFPTIFKFEFPSHAFKRNYRKKRVFTNRNIKLFGPPAIKTKLLLLKTHQNGETTKNTGKFEFDGNSDGA